MDKAAASPIPAKRIQNIIEYNTYLTFQYIARGLYETHKILFTVLLALKIDMHKKAVMYDEFRCFIKGGAALDMNTVQKKPAAWIADSMWLNLAALSKIHPFEEILNQITKNLQAWKTWFENDAPENFPLPDGYQASLGALP